MTRHFHYYAFSQTFVDDAISIALEPYDKCQEEGMIHSFTNLLHKTGAIFPQETPEQISSSVILSNSARIPWGMKLVDLQDALVMLKSGIEEGTKEDGLMKAFEHLVAKSGIKLPLRNEQGFRADCPNLNKHLKDKTS